MKRRARPAWAAVAALLCACGHGAIAGHAGKPATVTITFLETSDIHGFVETGAAELDLGGKKAKVARGGLPLLAGYVANTRRAHPGHVVLLDGGDMLQGTLVSNLGEGRAAIAAMNAMGYAAAALGNHEFDFGPVGPHAVALEPGEDPRGALLLRAHEARFPLLSANVVDDPAGPGAKQGTRIADVVKPFVVLDVDGIKVGIVGGTAEDTPHSTNPHNLSGLRVEPLAPAIAKAAAAARARGATVVVALVHEGGDCARFVDPDDLASCRGDAKVFELARALPPGTVDAIFGGHTHQGVAHRVAGIPIIQPFSHARAIGRLDLVVDRATSRVLPGPAGARIHTPVEVCAEVADGNESCDEHHARGHGLRAASYEGRKVEEDAAVRAAIAGDVAAAARERDQPVGVTLGAPLHARYRDESALGDLAADALRRAGHADVGLMNGGGLRADLPAGALRYGDLYAAFPFENRLAVLRLPGRALRALLAENFAGDHGVLSVSGLHAQGACRDRAIELSLTLDGGARLDDDRLYTVATIDFLASGGDDFASVLPSAAPGSIHVDLAGATLRDLVADELRRRGPVLDGDRFLFDPVHPRVLLPHARPFPCRPPTPGAGAGDALGGN